MLALGAIIFQGRVEKRHENQQFSLSGLSFPVFFRRLNRLISIERRVSMNGRVVIFPGYLNS